MRQNVLYQIHTYYICIMLENTIHSYEMLFILASYCFSHALRMILKFLHCFRYIHRCHDPLCVMCILRARISCMSPPTSHHPYHSASTVISVCVRFLLYCLLLSCYFPSIIIFRLVCAYFAMVWIR